MKISGVSALAGSLLLAGCVVVEHHQPVAVEGAVYPAARGTEVVVAGPPPRAPVEVVTPAPSAFYVWVPGAWIWHGRWDWERGHWVRPPRRGVRWEPPRCVERNGVHVWIRGGWR